MPPRLDLSHSTHSKMMVAPPRLNLRRAASYNSHDRGPLSSTSSRFSFNHLLFSPPPSPSLPALVPRPKKSPTQKILSTRPSRVLRRSLYLLVLITSFYLVALAVRSRNGTPTIWPYYSDVEFEMVGQDVLPDFPTPVVVHDPKVGSKWTISIPLDHDFPLSVEEYSDMSSQCREVSSRARDLHHQTPVSEQAQMSHVAHDDYFVDVREAEQHGLLHLAGTKAPARHSGHFVGLDAGQLSGKPICDSSMTFVLESRDAGLGNTMMLMWTLFGLAKEQGRAFFVDDTRWAYGDYTELFQPPPVPDCRPPPRHYMVPCPAQANHLVVSGGTANEIFPALLAKNHRLTSTGGSPRELLDLARVGYESLFSLSFDDQAYVDRRIRDLKDKARAPHTTARQAPIVGLHIRHGDQHPLEYQYRDTYIPSEVFIENAKRMADEYYGTATGNALAHRAVTVIASDDPMVHQEPDFSGALLAQERIQLASKDLIDEANDDPHVLHEFVDEAFGWEGGFFAPMFWNLGVDRRNNAANAPEGVQLENINDEARLTAPPSDHTLKLRSLIGRAYMMDLAVLAGASDNVVCAVSAMGCRLLGVMMGWDKGMERGGWVNVDGDYPWAGIKW